jgi:hypothetical protein
VPVATVGRKGINHPIGSFIGRKCFGCWAQFVDGVVFWRGEILGRLGVDEWICKLHLILKSCSYSWMGMNDRWRTE